MAEALPDIASVAAKAPDIDDPTAGTEAFGHRFVDAVAAHVHRCAARLRSWAGSRPAIATGTVRH
jgi:hypothetical protein